MPWMQYVLSFEGKPIQEKKTFFKNTEPIKIGKKETCHIVINPKPHPQDIEWNKKLAEEISEVSGHHFSIHWNKTGTANWKYVHHGTNPSRITAQGPQAEEINTKINKGEQIDFDPTQSAIITLRKGLVLAIRRIVDEEHNSSNHNTVMPS